MKGSSTLFTRPPAAAALSTMEAKASHHARRSDSLFSAVQVSNLHLQFAKINYYPIRIRFASGRIKNTCGFNLKVLSSHIFKYATSFSFAPVSAFQPHFRSVSNSLGPLGAPGKGTWYKSNSVSLK